MEQPTRPPARAHRKGAYKCQDKNNEHAVRLQQTVKADNEDRIPLAIAKLEEVDGWDEQEEIEARQQHAYPTIHIKL